MFGSPRPARRGREKVVSRKMAPMPWAIWTATEWAAFAAVATLLLFIVLVVATIYYAKQTKATVDELREARIVETLPVLHWQQPSCPSESTGTYYLAQLVLNLTNYD